MYVIGTPTIENDRQESYSGSGELKMIKSWKNKLDECL
jgi:hypothetical protein